MSGIYYVLILTLFYATLFFFFQSIFNFLSKSESMTNIIRLYSVSEPTTVNKESTLVNKKDRGIYLSH